MTLFFSQDPPQHDRWPLRTQPWTRRSFPFCGRGAASLIRFARSGNEAGVCREDGKVNVFGKLDVPDVDLENFFGPLISGLSTRTCLSNLPGLKGQGQDFGLFCSAHDDDARLGIETVHFRKKLIERLLAFVMRGEGFIPLALPSASSSSMNMIHGAFCWAAKRGPVRGMPDTDKHLNKIGALRLKNGTFASPATALARSVLPVPVVLRGVCPWGSFPRGRETSVDTGGIR